MVVVRRLCAIALLAAASLLPIGQPASAAEFLIQEGIDSSPYSFIPSLVRGLRDTQYAFTGFDESGASHNFRTFVRFDLPPDLLGPDETVTEAYTWIYYSFDFTGFGDANDLPGEVHCSEVLESWSETSLTWIDQPAFGPTLDVHPDILDLGLVWCDVTDLVRDWATGAKPNHGIAFTNPTERLIGFYSFEATFVVQDFRPSLVIATGPSATADLDSDGVPDSEDNCPDVQNAEQVDSNTDGIGDACAFAYADLDQNLLVNWNDVQLLQLAIGSTAGQAAYDEACDFDGDGDVDSEDEATYDVLYEESFTGGASCGLVGIEVLIAAGLARVRSRGRRR